MQSQNKANKSSSIPPPQVPRYMPLIQQKLPKKLEVVQENAVSGDLPDINLRNNQTEISMSLS